MLQVDGTGSSDSTPAASGDSSRLAWIRQAFGLSSFDLDVLLIALAPELDLRYERLYAYLQDDVSRRRPSVDLALNLLCDSPASKLAMRVHVGVDAPLVRHGLLRLVPDPAQPQPPLLAHTLKLDDQIVDRLAGQTTLDRRLAACAVLVHPAQAALEHELPAEGSRRVIEALAATAGGGQAPRLYLHGPPGAGQRSFAETLAWAV